MKKFYFLLAFIWCWGTAEANAATTELWNGNQTVSWENVIAITADKFSGLTIGDVLHVTITDVTAGATTDNWLAQVAIVTNNWTQIEEDFVLAESYTEATFTLTGDILALIKANGLLVTGNGYTATRIYTESSVYTGTSNSVWLGNLSGENYWFTIHFNHFKNANNGAGIAVGDIIRLTYTTGDDNWLTTHYYGEETSYAWKEFEDAAVIPTATGCDIVVTESMASILTKNLLVIQANNCNMTQVELIAKEGEPEPYAVLSEDNTTLTFYYDGNKESRGGMGVGPYSNSSARGWDSNCSNITTVVFDASFADCTTLTSTASWFYGCGSLTTITGISNLKTENVTDMSNMFRECSGLTSLDVSKFNTANVTNMYGMFANCSGLTSLDLSNFNTSNVTGTSFSFSGMSKMFNGCSSLTSLDLSNFNTAKVRWMDSMFEGCSALTSLNVSSFDIISVRSLNNMFANCSNMTSLDVSNFNTANVTSMESMFSGCSSLTSLDVSNFFTYNVTEMSEMFFGCKKLTNLDVSRLVTRRVSSMYGMFKDCSSLLCLDLSNFDVSQVNDMRDMFKGCSSLVTIYCDKAWSCSYSEEMFVGCVSLKGGISYDANKTDITYANIETGYFTASNWISPYVSLSEDNKVLTFYYDDKKSSRNGMRLTFFPNYYFIAWSNVASDITSVIFDASFAEYTEIPNTVGWFEKCKNLNSISGMEYLNTCNVQYMTRMFEGCSSLGSIDLSHFDTKNVLSMERLFYGCSALTSLDVSNFNTENVMSMYCMFNGCSALTSLDVSKFNTEKVINMYGMFSGCSSLTSLDVSNFNTENVADMSNMFYKCSKLTSLDVSKFNTGNVTSMYYMFSGCSALTSLDVSKFNTGNVTNMSIMFSDCTGLTSLDLSNFNTAKVTEMYSMFKGCSGLTSLDLTNFNTENVTNMSSMFSGCSALTSLDLTNFNTENVTDMKSMFYGCSKLTSLDVSNFNTENVTSMGYMFYGCSGLTTIYCNNTWSCSSSRSMFYGCTSLIGAISYDKSKTDATYANPTTGYFTKKPFTLGDANGDGSVTITDAVAVVNKILGNASGNFNEAAADVSGDGQITITDAVGVVNIILSNGAAAPAMDSPQEQEPEAIPE